MNGAYYTSLDNELTVDESESCNHDGKHLASAHSPFDHAQMNLLLQTCAVYTNIQSLQCDHCWTGLNGRMDTQTFEWRDNTAIDTSLITHWCQSHPLMPSNQSYPIYIDPLSNCIHPSINSSFETCGICGPQMMDTTNGLYAFSYTTIPCISAFGFLSLLYIAFWRPFEFISNTFLKNNNYKKTQFVIIPSTPIKRTAIWTLPLMTVLFVSITVLYSVLDVARSNTGIMPPSAWIDNEYPDIYMFIAVMKFFIAALYVAVTVVVYLHLLFRVHHSFNNNPVFRAELPTKCQYGGIFTLIVLSCLHFILYIMIHSQVLHLNQSNDILEIYAISSLGLVDVVIYSLLGYFYCYALYKFKSYYYKYEKANESEFNQNQVNHALQFHCEISIEFRRYTVLFVMACVVHIISTMLVIAAILIAWMHEDDQAWVYVANVIVMTLLYCKMMVSFACIYLSFKPRHAKYKKWCNICDKWMQKVCNKMVKSKAKLTTIDLKSKPSTEEGCVTETVPETVIDNPYASNEETHVANRDQITIDDYLPTGEHVTESHPNIAAMQNAEENVDAINGL
eukprot:634880_1